MPAWMTPLLAPVWPVARAGARSSTTASRSGRRRVSSRATAKPTIPPPMTARSHSAGGAPISAGLLLRYSAPEEREVCIDHQTDHLFKACARLPTELLPRLGGVADQMLDLGRTQEAGIDPDVPIGIQPDVVEGDPHELANRVRLAGGDHEVIRLVLLEHEPHGLDVVLGVAPIALRIEAAEGNLLLEPELDGGRAMSDLTGDELEPAPFRVVDDHATDADAEPFALGLEVEYELGVLDRLSDAPDLGRVLAQMLSLGPDAHGRSEVQGVVGAAGPLLHVDRGGLLEPVIHPAEALREHRAVRLDGHALALLEPVAGVVAAQEGLPDLGVRVQDERRDLFVASRGVELLAQPRARSSGTVQVELADDGVGIEPGSPIP